jgi:prolyl-tRNA editing enzyme YbaK/EbsC (Cys-tRNA(Pro) deacylase)
VATELPNASKRLFEAVDLDPQVHMFPEGTKTAEDAANAIGCHVSAIVKSLVFMVDEEPVVALVPGDLRLDTARLSEAAGGERRCAEPASTRCVTPPGFAAGGTPPFGHTTTSAGVRRPGSEAQRPGVGRRRHPDHGVPHILLRPRPPRLPGLGHRHLTPNSPFRE